MASPLTVTVLSFGLIGLLTITFFVLSLASMVKEHRTGEPTRGILPLGLLILALCVLVALVGGYFRFQPVKSITFHVDRIVIGIDE
jgi:hypothetical protein